MLYCLNPSCQQPINPDGSRFCMNCGKKLQLKGLYEAIALIGRGGMGRTFRGRDLGRLGHSCAIKQFLPQFQESQLIAKAIALFASEAAQLQSLGSHPQIPELIAYFEEAGCFYLVQELIEGENLHIELQLNGLFNESQIYELLESILPVLQFIHDRQVIHRDIKPDNIIRRKETGNRKQENVNCPITDLVLVDFGAAKVFTNNITNPTGTLIGSPEYIAPEQARGKAVIQSDLYSLGITCIYLLTGISPFDLYDDARDRWIWREKMPTSISSNLAMILDRLLERAITNRYSSAKAILEAIENRDVTGKSSVTAIQLGDESKLDELRLDGLRLDELRNMLNLGQWQEGDRLTNKIILELAHKEKIAKLTASDINQIRCDIWFAIDEAWTQASNHRFGWSVQKQIWQGLGGRLIYEEDTYWEFASTYERFADRVGWRKSRWLNLAITPKIWRKYESLTFTINAPKGHLPSLFFWEGFNLVDLVFYRLEICNLSN